MSKPTNSAARNQMTEWERQCYDWGWEDAEERIIKLLEAQCTCRTVMRNGYMGKLICPAHTHIALIKGENK